MSRTIKPKANPWKSFEKAFEQYEKKIDQARTGKTEPKKASSTTPQAMIKKQASTSKIPNKESFSDGEGDKERRLQIRNDLLKLAGRNPVYNKEKGWMGGEEQTTNNPSVDQDVLRKERELMLERIRKKKEEKAKKQLKNPSNATKNASGATLTGKPNTDHNSDVHSKGKLASSSVSPKPNLYPKIVAPNAAISKSQPKTLKLATSAHKAGYKKQIDGRHQLKDNLKQKFATQNTGEKLNAMKQSPYVKSPAAMTNKKARIPGNVAKENHSKVKRIASLSDEEYESGDQNLDLDDFLVYDEDEGIINDEEVARAITRKLFCHKPKRFRSLSQSHSDGETRDYYESDESNDFGEEEKGGIESLWEEEERAERIARLEDKKELENEIARKRKKQAILKELKKKRKLSD